MQPQRFDRFDRFGQAGQQAMSPEQASAAMGTVMAKVFWWMAIGLGLSGLVAVGIFESGIGYQLAAMGRFAFFGIVGVEFALVWYISSRIATMSPAAAKGAFVVYSALNGLTLSFIFMAYTMSSIANVFFITCGMFGAMAVYGTVTKRDLSGWGSFLFMGLIGVVIASVVNFWLHSPMLHYAVGFAGVLVFVGLTAYDTQKIRRMALGGGLHEDNLAVLGALMLYLDFINLFLMLLRLFGDRR